MLTSTFKPIGLFYETFHMGNVERLSQHGKFISFIITQYASIDYGDVGFFCQSAQHVLPSRLVVELIMDYAKDRKAA